MREKSKLTVVSIFMTKIGSTMSCPGFMTMLRKFNLVAHVTNTAHEWGGKLVYNINCHTVWLWILFLSLS